jgi:hypothetical protein
MNNESIYNLDQSKTQAAVTLPPYAETTQLLEDKFKDCPDIIKRNLTLNNKQAIAIYVEGSTDLDLVQNNFINIILNTAPEKLSDKNYLQSLPVGNLTYYSDINIIITEILYGSTIIIVDGLDFAIGCKFVSVEKRKISEPETEKNIKGSHAGFIEDINTNMSLLRARIKNTTLKFKEIRIGTTTNQKVLIAYIEGIANNDMLNNLYSKVQAIDFDGLIGVGYIEQFISDFPLSPFPQHQMTERIDKTVASLLEGKFVIMLDGTPVMIIAPVSYFAFFRAPDDFNSHWIIGSFLGLLRELGMILAVFLPALYIAIISFHYYMIPLDLLLQLARSRVKIPFPPIIEALIMEVTIELLREAAIRLPSYVGTTIGVVGGLVIGEAAVSAGIVGELLLIVVAVTAIASYVIPSNDMALAVRITRFALIILAAVFGIIGFVVGAAFLVAHLLKLESLGQPYLKPVIPFNIRDLKDVFIRLPLKYHKKRPTITNPQDNKRGKNNG